MASALASSTGEEKFGRVRSDSFPVYVIRLPYRFSSSVWHSERLFLSLSLFSILYCLAANFKHHLWWRYDGEEISWSANQSTKVHHSTTEKTSASAGGQRPAAAQVRVREIHTHFFAALCAFVALCLCVTPRTKILKERRAQSEMKDGHGVSSKLANSN